MLDRAAGGNDQILAAEGRDIGFGDACEMSGQTRGGNDVLDGGTGPDFLFGDAAAMSGQARGGNDSLASMRGARRTCWWAMAAR